MYPPILVVEYYNQATTSEETTKKMNSEESRSRSWTSQRKRARPVSGSGSLFLTPA
jgi:hypothetical protein